MDGYRSFHVLILGLCLLVTTALAVPLQDPPRGVRQTDSALCSSQNTALLSQANAHSQSALGKADAIYQTLNSFFLDRLSSCQSTNVNKLNPHLVLITTYDITHFDVNHILPALEPSHECSHLQNEINATVSYLECATNFIGLILQNLTSDIIQYNHSNSSSVPTTREAVYETYKNVSWITDIKKLTKVFPCAKTSSDPVSTCTTTYSSIQVEASDQPYNSCVKTLLSSEGAVYQKQAVVLAHVTELVGRLKSKLKLYMGKCLSLSNQPI